MSFSANIPEKVLENLNVSAFVRILDELLNFKTEIISRALHTNNPAILMDKKWLLKELEEYGVTNIPYEYPIQVIRQLLLNVDVVCGTRGSKIGIELFCSLMSLGEVTIDDSKFYAFPSYLLLDSEQQGYIIEDNEQKNFYLVEDSDLLNQRVTLKITVKSRYFNGNYPQEEKMIQQYLNETIGNQLGFSPDKEVIFEFLPREEFYFHKLLNPYFV